VDELLLLLLLNSLAHSRSTTTRGQAAMISMQETRSGQGVLMTPAAVAVVVELTVPLVEVFLRGQ
jgi:hypothetical protein